VTSSFHVDRYRVRPGERVDLQARDPADTGPYHHRSDAQADFASACERITYWQELLWAEHAQSLLVIFQAMDTGGKDGAIKDVFGHVNPQGVRAWSFKAPTSEELDHDFLWRCHERAPARGTIGIFNRSQYEDVLVARVHELVPETVWRARYEQINQFESLLVANGTTIVKFFLHISKAEQKERLEKRRDDPEKRWKFSLGDLDERTRWADYQAAYAEALTRCSTEAAPWYVVPADKKWYRNVVVATVVAEALERMCPRLPEAAPGIENVQIPD
jgi:PPK2 family polyphosphate:nucleotide phosphotransferase